MFERIQAHIESKDNTYNRLIMHIHTSNVYNQIHNTNCGDVLSLETDNRRER